MIMPNSHVQQARPRVAITHPWLALGGSEAVALRAIEALQQDHDVTLLTAGPVDFDTLNAHFGTSLTSRVVRVRRLQPPRWLRSTRRLTLLRASYFARAVRDAAGDFDLVLNAYNPISVQGPPAIHYLADLSFDDALRNRFDPPSARVQAWYRNGGLRRIYRRLAGQTSGQLFTKRGDIVLATSDWVRGLASETLGLEAQTLYPPVAPLPPVRDRQDHHTGFLWLGRVSAEKRPERAVTILDGVRRRGHRVCLCLAGPGATAAQVRSWKRLAHDGGSWITYHGAVDATKKAGLLRSHPFGITTRPYEPFGIVVAEMVLAGCLPFVPAGGGQIEVVPHEHLQFQNEADAVEKIVQVLDNPSLRGRLAARLISRAPAWSVPSFQAGLRRAVARGIQWPTAAGEVTTSVERGRREPAGA